MRLLTNILTFLYLFTMSSAASAQCSCTDCPLFILSNTSESSVINVSGLTNTQLGVNGQGICGVALNLLSDAVDEINVILTLPNGTTIELIQQSGLSVGQNYLFDIVFVPCNTTAMPDPGFSAQFNSSENWPSNSTFTGTYYPQSGDCLENLTGPANGNYTLTIEDNVFADHQELLDWELIFCDGSGTACGPSLCGAEGGEALTNITPFECEGSPQLLLNNILIDYGAGTAADPTLHDYTFIVTNTAGDIVEIGNPPDLTALPAGVYDVCGVSYLIADAGLLPSVGQNISDLENDIAASTICADIVDNCSQVGIQVDLADVVLDNFPNPADFCPGEIVTLNIADFDPAFSSLYLISIISGSFSQFSYDQATGEITVSSPGGIVQLCTSWAGSIDCDNVQTCYDLNFSAGSPAPNLSGPTELCVNDIGTIQVTDIPLQSLYTWTITGPGVILNDFNSSLEIQSLGVGQIEVCATYTANGCPSEEGCFTVDVNTAVPPSTNIVDDFCMPGGFFAGNANGSATSTVWTQVAGPGTISFFNANVVATQWTVDQPGIYTVRLTKQNNGCESFDEATFEVFPEVDFTSQVECANGEFVVTLTFNGTGPFSVFGTPVGGNVYVSPPYLSGSAVLTTFEDGNGCEGEFFAQEFCNCTTDAGTMSNQLLEICGNGDLQGIHNNDATFDSDDIGVYILHTSPNDVLGTIISINSTGSFAFDPAFMTYGQPYYISYVVGTELGGTVDLNDVCLSVAEGQIAIWYEPITPTIFISSDPVACDLSLILEVGFQPNITISSGNWTVVSGPAGGIVTFADPNSIVTQLDFSVAGTYEISFSGAAGPCTFTDVFEVTAAPPFIVNGPTIECSPTSGFYEVSFTISGGTEPYTVNGTATGSNFTSMPFLNGENTVFVISEDGNCPDFTFNVNDACPCTSDAGNIAGLPLELCDINDEGFVSAPADASLDDNDAAVFVLHTNSGNTLGTILASNNTGAFSFDPASMIVGQTYYISYVVGNNNGGDVDLNDPCLSVSFGQEVVWLETPQITLVSGSPSCFLTTLASVDVSSGGNVQWTFLSSSTSGTAIIANPNSANTIIDFDQAGLYTFEVSTAYGSNCVEDEQIEIEVLSQIEIVNLSENCDGLEYTVGFDIVGGEAPYFVNGTLISGNIFQSSPIASGDSYVFTVVDANGCEATDVTGSRNCDCDNDAGTMQATLITLCDLTDVANSSVPTDADILTGDIGLFYLHEGDNTTLVNILDSNASGTFAFDPTSMVPNQVYYISYVVGNDDGTGAVDLTDLCLSVSFGQPVVWRVPSEISVEQEVNCSDTVQVTVGSSFSENLSFTILAGPGTINGVGRLDTTYFIDLTEEGNYTILAQAIENTCLVLDTFEVELLPALEFSVSYDCDIAAGEFTAEITATGGTAPYSFLGDSFNTSLSLDNLPTGVLLTGVIVDNNGCISDTVNIQTDCECEPLQHQIDNDTLFLCNVADAFSVQVIQSDTIPSDYLSYFILVNPNDIFNPLFISTDGNFPANVVSSYGDFFEVYFVSGFEQPTMPGFIDLADDCTNFSNPQVLTFINPNILDILADISLCETEITLPAAIEGFDIEYSSTNSAVSFIRVEDSVSVTLPESGSFQVTANRGGVCPVETTFEATVYAQVVLQEINYGCSEDLDSFQVFIVLTGGVAPFTVNGEVFPSREITIPRQVLSPTFSYQIQDVNGCNLIEGSLTIDCSCTPYNFDVPDELCVSSSEVDLSPFLLSNGTGEWQVAGGASISNGDVLLINSDFEGELELTFIPDAVDACEPEYTFSILIDREQMPVSTIENELSYCYNELQELNLNTLLENPVDAEWQSVSVIDVTAFTDGVLDLNQIDPGVYEFQIEVEAGPVCDDGSSASLEVQVFDQIAYEIFFNYASCENLSNELEINVSSEDALSEVTLNGEVIDTTVITDLMDGIYSLNLVDQNNCRYQEDFELPLYEVLDLALSLDLDGDQAIVTANVTGGAQPLSFDWFVNDIANGAADEQITISAVVDSTLVVLEVTDDQGCIAADSIFIVKALENWELPNVIASNSTNNGEIIIPPVANIARVITWSIYDRWGNNVFVQKDFDPKTERRAWDASFNGSDVEPGVYVYLIEYIDRSGKLQQRSGDLTVLR